MTTSPAPSPEVPRPRGFPLHIDGLAVSAPDSGRELLREITLAAKPGEFVCILGPSGSGKTTLVRTLLGQLPPSQGSIRFGSLQVSGDARALAGLVGYVPQKEIVHDALPAGRALHYAARLRLPPALPAGDLAGRIASVAADVGISQRLDTPVGRLSGGEAKRVGLAVELLALPPLLIVDEATSSLDPASDARIMKLLSGYAKAHRITVLCITHHLENAQLADRLVMLAAGRLIWSGGVPEALEHFGARSLSEIYVLLEDFPVEQWVGLHRVFQHQAAAEGEQRAGASPPAAPPAPPDRPGWFRQFGALFRRGLEVLVRDRRSASFLVAVPLVMLAFAYAGFSTEPFGQKALLSRPLEPREIQLAGQLWGHVQAALAIPEKDASLVRSIPAQIRVFLDKEVKIREGLRSPEAARIIQQGLAGKVPLVPEREIINPMSTWKFQLTVIFGICILGFLAGLTEVVKERAIVERETACGVRPSAYVASKLALLAVVLAVQIVPPILLLQALFQTTELLGGPTGLPGGRLGPTGPFLALCFLAAMACAGIGLAISALARQREQALLVLPLLLLPQLLLGGLLIRLDGGLLAGIAEIGVPTFWAFRGSIEYVVFQPPVPAFDLGSPISTGKAATALGLQLVAAWALAFAALAYSLRRKA
ncbi:MAG: ABC transporter ATP-binding protein, partial [Opitutaceae bacterium]